ncbi:MAG: two-component system LytT family response regulator [Crocinitomicaceae bacterium]|jgi:two-component system LytT family response regulator
MRNLPRPTLKQMKLKALILDDETENLEHLSYWIDKYCAEQIEVVAVCQTIEGAEEGISTHEPDVLFLDVQLANGVTSFELLPKISEWEGKIVFVTAHKDYAIQAIKTRAFDYLLKPVSIEELISTVQEIHNSYYIVDNKPGEDLLKEEEGLNDFICISHLTSIQVIKKSKIMYLTSSGNYTEIFLEDEPSTLSSKIIKVYESILSDKNFVRVHNSHMINIDYLKKINKENGWVCIMSNEVQIPVSRRKKDLLANLLNTI